MRSGPAARGRGLELIAAAALAAAGCGKSSQPPAVATDEVHGKLSLDGTPRTITRCDIRERGGDTDLRLVLDGGAVVTYAEAERKFFVAPEDSGLRGEQYPCKTGGAHDIMFGSGAGLPGFFHGRIDFVCSRGESQLEGHLQLRCGTIDEATRARMQQEIENARKTE